ncbi:FIST N-terminal domain-containing protein [Egicoccus sp. AB-alg6-2]|uniref:FIST signal transduction protein n=1 Tax=Egicoccus sp. AB-alg6-2 TaxID=3242692 RepID=UPI00359EA577
MRTSASLSRTPEGALAAAEAADAVAVALGDHCDLAVVFVRPEHADDLEAVALAVETRLEPGVLIGALAQGVVGPGEEVESGPGVVVWGAHLPQGQVQPFRVWSVRTAGGGMAVAGWPDTQPDDVVLLLADPLSFPAAEVAVRVGDRGRGPTIVGGLLTGGEGRSRFFLDGQLHDDGAVGVILRDLDTTPLVSQGCRPIGIPLTVTAADRNRILELGGEPAAGRLQEMLHDLDDDERDLLERGGLQIGLVVDEVRDTYATGDFLVRGVLAVDPARGSITVGDLPRIGQTVQFQVRDAETASADLAAVLGDAGPAVGTLLFTCTGRGSGLFGICDHDVRAIELALGGAVAGAFCAGELGPVGDRSHLHGYTASMLLFGSGEDDTPPD